MDLTLPISAAAGYSSSSQRIRVITEYWVNSHAFCPNCGDSLNRFANNAPVADFYCRSCLEEYELKSKGGGIGKKVVDGAYATMIQRLSAENNPHFFLLSYDKATLAIRNFFVIPKYFFVPEVIEKRSKLPITARRAGWIGCNIVVDGIPDFGKVFYIRNGVTMPKDQVLANWSRTYFISNKHNIEAKGWLLDVMRCVERINKRDFSLGELYAFIPELKAKHPANNNIEAKIRQQLQLLRDRGLLDFIAPGMYRTKI